MVSYQFETGWNIDRDARKVTSEIWNNGALIKCEHTTCTARTTLDPISWLESRAPGFADLTKDERDLIMNFSLLWSLFEAEVLSNAASVNAIPDAVRRWDEAHALTSETFGPAAAYFKSRYYSGGAFTRHFEYLHLERSGDPEVVRNVLSGRDGSPSSVATAVLVIVFRFRNNLFHGEKWAYGLKAQGDNFAHANDVLMRAIDLDREVPPGAFAATNG